MSLRAINNSLTQVKALMNSVLLETAAYPICCVQNEVAILILLIHTQKWN